MMFCPIRITYQTSLKFPMARPTPEFGGDATQAYAFKAPEVILMCITGCKPLI